MRSRNQQDAGADVTPNELTGSRIRDRRMDRAIRQSDLARMAGISASYLNLIEHNKRRIGGKLLVDIARALDVAPASLSEGVEPDVVTALGAAAAAAPEVPAEHNRADELAGRFPGWAGLVVLQARRLEMQARAIETLNDRLTHDPVLNAALHEVLSTVTAIRSTAAILNEGDEIEPAWRHRFHRNLYEDSRRLAASAQALVAYLDRSEDAAWAPAAPLDTAEAWFADAGWDPAAPPPGDAADDDAGARAGRALAARWHARLAEDARRLPDAAFMAARAERPDPVALAETFGTDVAAILRRWAILPEAGEAGLVVCDGSGTPVFRRSVAGFAVPSLVAACPLWPLYGALAQPGVPVRARIRQTGRLRRTFLAYAVAQTVRPEGFDGPVLNEATMLLLPDPPPGPAPDPVGPSCRVCPRVACPARREPSVLGDA